MSSFITAEYTLLPVREKAGLLPALAAARQGDDNTPTSKEQEKGKSALLTKTFLPFIIAASVFCDSRRNVRWKHRQMP
jgi:hypothetical protein